MSNRKPKQIAPEDFAPSVVQLREIRTEIVRAQVRLEASLADGFAESVLEARKDLERVNVMLCRLIQRLEPREK